MDSVVGKTCSELSEVAAKVREATSNDPWGPSSSQMSDIADLTFLETTCTDVMQMIWKRLGHHGKNWRHVYKSLKLLSHLLTAGSISVSLECRKKFATLQMLREFQYEENGQDHGRSVRQLTAAVIDTLQDVELSQTLVRRECNEQSGKCTNMEVSIFQFMQLLHATAQMAKLYPMQPLLSSFGDKNLAQNSL